MLRNLTIGAGCLLVVLLAAACGGNDVFPLGIGDCFDDPSSSTFEFSDLKAFPCSKPHDNEVYAVGTYYADGSVGPEFQDYGRDYCELAFENYVGRVYWRSSLSHHIIFLGQDEVEEGDYELFCCLYSDNPDKLQGSMKGSRE